MTAKDPLPEELTEDATPAFSPLSTEEHPRRATQAFDLTRHDLLIVALIQDGTLPAQEVALARDIITQHGEATFFCFLQARENLQARTAAAPRSPRHASNGQRCFH